MDEYIKINIDARRKAIVDAYIIDDTILLDELASLILQMEELGGSCEDAAAFETALAASPINSAYADLYTRIASQFPSRSNPHEEAATDARNAILDDLTNLAERALDDVTYSARREAYEASREKIEDIPVIGELSQLSRTVSVFNKWFKKK